MVWSGKGMKLSCKCVFLGKNMWEAVHKVGKRKLKMAGFVVNILFFTYFCNRIEQALSKTYRK